MPPKKKGGKAKSEAAPVLTGPEAELEAERQLLIAEAKALKRRKDLEEVEYNEYQQEKVGCPDWRWCHRVSTYLSVSLGDFVWLGAIAACGTTFVGVSGFDHPSVASQEKLNYFWIVQKKKIEDLKAALRNKEREEQDVEEKHQVEIKVRCC
jgi:hypothetical protein